MNVNDIASRLRQQFNGDEGKIAFLNDRLVEAAELSSAIDVGFRYVDSPVGALLLAATEEGVVRIAFENEDEGDVLQELTDRVSPRVMRAPRRLEALAGQLDEYFIGERREFDVRVDDRLSRGFRRAVLAHLREITYGSTASYSAVAAIVGNPRAVRAVGTACATNPIPIVIPCHRVLRSDGTLGGYRGGLEAKRRLLALETRDGPSMQSS